MKTKRIIIVERRQNADEGNLATNYRLHIQDTLGQEVNQAESQSFTTPLVSEIDQQQETVTQETEAALAAQLLRFGIDKPTVDRLLKSHDHPLIAQKIDYVVFMEESQAPRVKNPRGGYSRPSNRITAHRPATGRGPCARRTRHRFSSDSRIRRTPKLSAGCRRKRFCARSRKRPKRFWHGRERLTRRRRPRSDCGSRCWASCSGRPGRRPTRC